LQSNKGEMMVTSREISIIVAMTPNRVIGHNGEMPWYLPSDLKRFAKITKGHPVIMGRKTYESIIKRLGCPLPARTNIVLTQQSGYQANGCIVASSIDEALEKSANVEGAEEVFIIGGAMVYRSALECATKVYLTLVLSTQHTGDTFFPHLGKEWQFEKGEESEKGEKDDCYSCFSIYRRKNATGNNYVNLKHARTEEQESVMKKIYEDGVCPFCIEHLKNYHTKTIIKEGSWWIVTENFAPYEGTLVHLLFIYKKHETDLSQIDHAAFNELYKFVSLAKEKYGIRGGSFFMRFGDTERTGATVDHIHAQLIAGNSSRTDGGEKLKVSLGYKKPK